MLSNRKSSRFYSVKGFALLALALALLMNVTAFASENSRFAFIDTAAEFFGLQTASAPVSITTEARSNAPALVAVQLPTISATTGSNIAVAITVGDMSAASEPIFAYDFNLDYDPTVLAVVGGGTCAASACYSTGGTLSSASTITPNPGNPGHFIISAFQATAFSGSGTLLILNFNVIGAQGTSTTLVFADYTSPTPSFHPAFIFNDFPPTSIVTGSVTVPAATATNTATSTNTDTPTPTATSTFTPTNTHTPTATSTNTFTPTPTPLCLQVDIEDSDALNGDPVTISVTTTDTTAAIPQAFSSDFRISYDPSVLAAPTVALGAVGASNGSSLTVNQPAVGQIYVSLFSTTPYVGAGSLVDITFPTVTGAPGTFSPISFVPFVNHPTGFMFNEGFPDSCVTQGSVSIRGELSGNIVYRPVAVPNPRPVPNTTLTSFGGLPLPGPALTDTLGNYSIAGYGPFSYVVVPSRSGTTAPNTHGSSISAFDASQIAQRVVQLITFSLDQDFVADVTGELQVTSLDSSKVALWAVSLPNTDFTGDWRFAPSQRTYPSVTNQINENYVAYLMGDVTGNWCDPTTTVPGCSGTGTVGLRPAIGPVRSTQVKASQVTAPAGDKVVVPVSIQGAGNRGITAYQFDLRYDHTVIQPQTDAVTLAGTISSDFSVVVNATTPGLLKVAVYGVLPLSDAGALLNFNFIAVGDAFSVSPITWENFMFNEGGIGTSVINGEVRLTAPVHTEEN